uniref:Carbohydrate kinase FGGY N-terminal domain-containing protein n=1 Tax=Anguilla anguilla TaxID=7936 RepID=A0A0E9UGT9_ANGAN
MGAQRNGFKRESYILSVDVGITSIRCHIYDKNAVIKGSCSKKVKSKLTVGNYLKKNLC